MANPPLRIEREADGPAGGVATLWLEQPGRPVVVLDHALMQVLDRTIDALDADLRGLVVASASDRAFVAGADLKTIVASTDEDLDRYLGYGARVLGRLASLPYPTAAAIGGAALGGGLELAMHCDGLIGAPSATGKAYMVGLPEAGLGLCPGWGGTNLLPARIDAGLGLERAAGGRPMTDTEARDLGLFDRVAESASDLLETAKQWVAERASGPGLDRDGAPGVWIGRPGIAGRVGEAVQAARAELSATGPGAAVVDAVDAGLGFGYARGLETERRHLIELRKTEPARRAIESFFARSGKG